MKKLITFYKSEVWLLAFIIIHCAVLVACSKSDDQSNGDKQVQFTATFTKSNGSVVSAATGTVSGTYNPSTYELTYTINWNNLTSTVADMHFHDNGPIIIHIEGFPTAITGTFSGKAIFTATQGADLMAGKVYVQIHTANFPGGEIIAALNKSASSPPPSGY
ncbi:hypothetical protein C3K47_07680 [Solitalea longa]|uniref:CHRD domain-containing protein n=1 Tax=Solitalea longa TaxID=2079460 RepID=A0A2S5A308_9SPHI|nr:CHRD domain-containing protein [Solitalea longa]POY36935.1 hypothetical protein C3K47_07680 [Solitalea longa]